MFNTITSATEKMEILDNINRTIKRSNYVNLHDAVLILEFALEYVNDKSDLYDDDILDIKAIRSLIKGL